VTVEQDVQLSGFGGIIQLFVLDATALGDSITHPFTNHKNEVGNNVVWGGTTYNAWPIQGSGFEMNTSGSLPRPRLSVGNLGGTISALCRSYRNLIGAKVTRKLVPTKYLDAINFTGGINPYADPTAELASSIWIIKRKKLDTKTLIEFELGSPLDSMRILLPRRPIIQNVCTFRYRGDGCGYAGGAVADINDVPTAILANDKCGHRLSSCKLRFGEYGDLPFGGWPGVGLYRS
jgi:lambda family phage minor tail protein L